MNINDYKKQWRLKNPKKAKKQNKKDNKKQREQTVRILKELKINGCSICGYYKTYKSLDFHHVNNRTKSFEVNYTGILKYNNDKIINELNKCILICANCHREL